MTFTTKKEKALFYKKPEVPRGLDAQPYLSGGEVLDERYRIENPLGRGGFGQVFQAKDTVTKQLVALKIEPRDRNTQINVEKAVLEELSKCKQVPDLLNSGSSNEFSYLVLPVYSDNLYDLRRYMPDLRFKPDFCLNMFYQLVEILEAVHNLGYVHRDIKPSNFCLGRRPDERSTVFLIDFGMAKQFRDTDGSFIKRKDNVPFRGTSRYCSKRVHLHYDQGPCDDMSSLLFSITEMIEGDLPWKGDENDRMLASIKAKPIYAFDKFCQLTPIPLFHIANYVQKCTYEHELDYEFIKRNIKDAQDWLMDTDNSTQDLRASKVQEFVDRYLQSDRKCIYRKSTADAEKDAPSFPAKSQEIKENFGRNFKNFTREERTRNSSHSVRNINYTSVSPIMVENTLGNSSEPRVNIRNVPLDDVASRGQNEVFHSDEELIANPSQGRQNLGSSSRTEYGRFDNARFGCSYDYQRDGKECTGSFNERFPLPKTPSNNFSSHGSGYKQPYTNQNRCIRDKYQNQTRPRRHSEWNEPHHTTNHGHSGRNNRAFNSCKAGGTASPRWIDYNSSKPTHCNSEYKNRWSKMESSAQLRNHDRPLHPPPGEPFFVPHNIEGLDD